MVPCANWRKSTAHSGLCEGECATGKLPNHQTTVEGEKTAGMMLGPSRASWLGQSPKLHLVLPARPSITDRLLGESCAFPGWWSASLGALGAKHAQCGRGPTCEPLPTNPAREDLVPGGVPDHHLCSLSLILVFNKHFLSACSAPGSGLGLVIHRCVPAFRANRPGGKTVRCGIGTELNLGWEEWEGPLGG